MNFSSRFLKGIPKEEKKIEIDKVYNLDKEKDIILPLGTCFLDVLAKTLTKKKYKILTNDKDTKIGKNALEFLFGNFYNPLNLLDNLERIVLKKWSFKNADYLYSKEFDHYINLYVKARLKTKDLNLLKKRIEEMDNFLIQNIKKSKVIILSYTGTEVWIDKFSKKAWYSFYGNIFNQKCYNDQANLKILDYKKIKDITEKIIKILNKFGKKKIILMVTPNKLWTTYQNKDIDIIDTYTKSTYVTAFNDLVSKNVSYFPALEIINNLDENKKYRKDFRHINIRTHENILEPYFKKMYFKN